LILLTGALSSTSGAPLHTNDTHPAVAFSTSLSRVLAKVYAHHHARPWARAGLPNTTKWQNSARAKYLSTEAAIRIYANSDEKARRFQNFAIAVAMDWELMYADTYALLQAGYEGLIPWRTGHVVRSSWSEEKGNRFAALTSAVGDVALMEMTKVALLSNTTTLDFARALFFGQLQEVFAERGLSENGWQAYRCDPMLNPIQIHGEGDQSDAHFLPQLAWLTMPLDAAAWTQDLHRGLSGKWASYELRGARLWQEMLQQFQPVVHQILKKLIAHADLGPGTTAQSASRDAASRDTVTSPVKATFNQHGNDALIASSVSAVQAVLADFTNSCGVSKDAYLAVRSVYLSINVGNNRTIPQTCTCLPSVGHLV